MQTIADFLMQLLAGAAAGAALGKVLPQLKLGRLRNAVIGAVGGVVGGYWLHPFVTGPGPAKLDISALTGSIGGAILVLVIGVIWSLWKCYKRR